MARRRFVLGLVAIAAVAFLLRDVYIVTVTRNRTISFDEFYYAGEARNLVAGDGFDLPRAGTLALGAGAHPPLTGVMLVPAAWLLDGDVAMRFTTALAGVGVVVLIGLIARKLGGPRAGLLAAGIAAVYPNLWMNDGLVLAESFTALATAAVILLTYRLLREPTWKTAAGAGLACAAAMLSHGELAVLLPLLVVPALLVTKGLTAARRMLLVAVAVVAAALAVAPWEAYLLSRYEEPTFLSYGDGGVVGGANCDATYSGPFIGHWIGLCAPSHGEPSVAAARNRRRGFDYMKSHLTRLPVVATARVGRLWSVYRPFQTADLNESEGRPKWASLTGWAMFWPLVGLAVAGIVILRRRRVTLWPLVVPIVVVTLDAAGFYGLVRFRVPAEVPIVVLAATGLEAVVTRRRRVGSRRQALGDGTEVVDEVRELDLAPVVVGAQDR
ncbi:MAG TPA: glycosyltransferase family 39 protein [Acidimicrobiia bacterium]|nr:glycosyltransferase family 39 protein [Acidimicrobiia bacterium]